MNRVFALFVSLAVLGSAMPALAESLLELDYQAPAGICPLEGRYRDEVAARLGRVPFTDHRAPSGPKVRVRIGRRGASFFGMLDTGSGSAREIESTDCADLVATLASLTAVSLEPTPPAPREPRATEPRRQREAVAPSPRGGVRLHVTAGQEGLALHYVSDSAAAVGSGGYAIGWEFERLCTAPCETRLPRGEYQFAIGPGVAIPMPSGEMTRIDEDSEIHIEYTSRADTRWGGLGVAIGGSLLGTLMMLLAVPALSDGNGAGGGLLLGLGGAGMITSAIVGVLMMMTPDETQLTTQPLD